MIAFIDDHRAVHGVEPICKVLPIAPSTYHAHVAKRDDPAKLSDRARRDAALRIEVRRVFDANFRVYGVRKTWRQLRREGFDVARCGGGGVAVERDVRAGRPDERGALLRDERGMGVILIAHADIKRFDSPEVEPYERYQPKLQARSSALVQEWCDVVGFANYKTIVKSSDVGFNNKVSRGISTGERLLYTSEKPAYLAKNRYSLPDSLPLDWSALADAMTTTTETTKQSKGK